MDNNNPIRIDDEGTERLIQLMGLMGADGGGVRVTNGGLDVNIQDQSTPSVEHFMYQELNDIVISSNLVKGQNVIPLNPGHGIVNSSGFDRDYINIHYVDTGLPAFLGARFNQYAVVGIVGDNISITPPIAYALDVTKIETSKRVNVNMNAVGSFALPIKFETRPPNGLEWDLTRLIADMILTSAADDGKFGNLTALQNGVFFGFEGDNFTEYQLSIFDNGGWRASAFDVSYTVRSGGGGDYGLAVRKSSAGQDKMGVTIRLQGEFNDKFVKYVQDDLSLLPRYRIKIMGHIVE